MLEAHQAEKPGAPMRALRLLLAAAVGLPLAVTVAGAWLSWRQAWTAEAREVTDAAQAAAEYARGVFDGLVLRIDRAEDILGGLSDAEIRANEGALHDALARATTIGPQDIESREPYLFVYNRDAQPLVASNIYPVQRNRIFADRDFNRMLREAPVSALHVGQVYVGATTAEPFFALSRRRTRTGNALPADSYDGVINASVYVADAEAALRRLASRADGDMLVLVRADGALLARSIPVAPGTRIPAGNPMLAAMQRGERSMQMQAPSDIDGVERIVAFHRVAGYPVYAVAARPRSAVLSRWRDTVLPLVAAGVPAALALLGLVLLVWRGQRALAAANAALERRVAERTAALEVSERRNAEVLASIGEPIFAIDAERRIAYASASALAYWGLPAEQVLGHRLGTVFPHLVGSVAWDAVRDAVRIGASAHLCAVAEPTGHWVEIDIYPLPEGGITVAFRDVHRKHIAERDRRLSEVALRASEQWLRLAQEAGGIGAWETDLATGTRRWSDSTYRLWGLAPGSPLAQDLLIGMLHPEDREGVRQVLAQVLTQRGRLPELEFRIRRASDGVERMIHSWAEVIIGPDGRPVRHVGIMQDVTEQRRAEAALRMSEERLRLAQEAGGVGSWEWTLDGVLHWSESCHRLHGTDPTRPLTYDMWRACILPEDWRRQEAALHAVLDGTETRWETEYRFLRPSDGALRWIVGRGRVVREPETGRPLRMLGVALDVTEQRRAEERLVLLAREVDHRAKNALAVVQAAVRLAPKDDAGAFARAVEGRVAALARAQVLLADGGWQGAELRAVAEGALAAFLTQDRPCAMLEGPTVQLLAAATQPISLALHELATNAAKYGALSTAEGCVTLRWWRDEPARMLRLSWQEAGGPVIAEAPQRRGFGSRVIAATIREQLGGTMELRWEAAGLGCDIALPFARCVVATAWEAPAPAPQPA